MGWSRGTPLSRACSETGGAEALSWSLGGWLWPPTNAGAGDRPGWPEAQKGRVEGQQPRVVGAGLALSLDTMSWTAPWLGWRTGNSGWQSVQAAG